jgi:hypothetical protein
MACKSLPFRGGKNGVTTDKLTKMKRVIESAGISSAVFVHVVLF